jgi:hypothetical protein
MAAAQTAVRGVMFRDGALLSRTPCSQAGYIPDPSMTLAYPAGGIEQVIKPE